MEQKNVGQFYEENVGLVHAVARKGYNRLKGIGASYDYEDVVQDMSIMFIKSFEKFDPEKGRFSTYFFYAAYNRLNVIAKDFETERIGLNIKSVEEMSELGGQDFGYEERIAGVGGNPEQTYEAKATVEKIIDDLSPLAQLMASWLVDTPDEIENEFRAKESHALMARDMGIEKRCKSDLDLNFVCDMLVLSGRPKQAVARAKQEIVKTVRRRCNE